MFTYHHISTPRALIVTLILFAGLSSAVVVQDDWINPKAPDNSTTLTIGTTFSIQWTSLLFRWFPMYDPSADVTNLDLWITGYYQHQYQHLVTSRININATQSTLWKVQLPQSELEATPWWVFRFIQSGLTPDDTANQISSPGVYVQNLTAPASSTSSLPLVTSIVFLNPSASSTVSSSATLQSTGTSSVTTTVVPTSIPAATAGALSPTTPGLSTAAKAGIAVGAVVIAVGLLGLGWFLARRKSLRRSDISESHVTAGGASRQDDSKYYTRSSELSGGYNGYSGNEKQAHYFTTQELDNTQRVSHRAEMSASPMVR